MKFKHVILFSVSEFNKNKAKQGYFPQDGTVINAMINATTLTNYIAVGFE
ncbi:hypothetical protein [uncultured Vagococcus sp.]|nr:hypothetical protein [uncultured Vagococcus sp.]